MPFLRRATSLPALAGAFVVLTGLAMGPLRPVDRALHGFWSQEHTPYATDLFQMLDAVASQAVALPVLAVVAVLLAVRARTLAPLRTVVWAELAFLLGVGGVKVLLARGVPVMGDIAFFSGGALEHGMQGISYPSGHAAEAVLLYGAAVHLLRRQLVLSRPARVLLGIGWAGVVTLAVSVAYVLGFHWPTDLLGGLLLGGVLLHLVVRAERWWVTPAPALPPVQLH